MEHLMCNQRKYPQNAQPFNVGPKGSQANRNKALDGIKRQPGKARDEKPPNFVAHDRKSVTVRLLPKKESNCEMFLLGRNSATARKNNAQVQFHANPEAGYTGRGAASSRESSRSGSPASLPPRSRTPSPQRSGSRSPSASGSKPKPAWNAGPGARSRSPSSQAGQAVDPHQVPRLEGGRLHGMLVLGPHDRGAQAREAHRLQLEGGRLHGMLARAVRSRSPSRAGSRTPSPRPAMSSKAQGKRPAWNASPGPPRSRSQSRTPSSPARGRSPVRNASPVARLRSPSRTIFPSSRRVACTER